MFPRRDRALLITLAVILAALALLVTPPEGADPRDQRASTFRAAPSGALGLWYLLEELELPAERRTAPWVEDGTALDGPIALLAPTQTLTPVEIDTLIAWIRDGGTLLFGVGSTARDTISLAHRLGLYRSSLPEDSAGDRIEDARPATSAPDALIDGVHSVHGFRYGFSPDSGAAVDAGTRTILVARNRPVMIEFSYGVGRVIALSDVAPLRNARLREGTGALLAARLARHVTGPGEALHFDEYHHGYRAGGGPVAATWQFVRDTGPGHALVQLAIAGAALLLLVGHRFGAPLPSRRGRRRSPIEHVRALAGAYRGANARETARQRLLAGLARRLGRRIPRRPDATAEFIRSLEHSPAHARGAAQDVVAEWNDTDGADLVELARRIDTLLERVKKS